MRIDILNTQQTTSSTSTKVFLNDTSDEIVIAICDASTKPEEVMAWQAVPLGSALKISGLLLRSSHRLMWRRIFRFIRIIFP